MKLFWSTEPPNASGWYQVRNINGGTRFFRFVTSSGHVQDEEHYSCSTLRPRPTVKEYHSRGRLWAGPIPEPVWLKEENE